MTALEITRAFTIPGGLCCVERTATLGPAACVPRLNDSVFDAPQVILEGGLPPNHTE